jgi:ankyrin repeat protein
MKAFEGFSIPSLRVFALCGALLAWGCAEAGLPWIRTGEVNSEVWKVLRVQIGGTLADFPSYFEPYGEGQEPPSAVSSPLARVTLPHMEQGVQVKNSPYYDLLADPIKHWLERTGAVANGRCARRTSVILTVHSPRGDENRAIWRILQLKSRDVGIQGTAAVKILMLSSRGRIAFDRISDQREGPQIASLPNNFLLRNFPCLAKEPASAPFWSMTIHGSDADQAFCFAVLIFLPNRVLIGIEILPPRGFVLNSASETDYSRLEALIDQAYGQLLISPLSALVSGQKTPTERDQRPAAPPRLGKTPFLGMSGTSSSDSDEPLFASRTGESPRITPPPAQQRRLAGGYPRQPSPGQIPPPVQQATRAENPRARPAPANRPASTGEAAPVHRAVQTPPTGARERAQGKTDPFFIHPDETIVRCFQAAATGDFLFIQEELSRSDSDRAQEILAAKSEGVWHNGQTLFQYAAEAGHFWMAQKLIDFQREHAPEKLGEMINARDSVQKTSLHLAAFRGQKDVVWLLLQQEEIDVNAIDRHGQTPLHLAIERGDDEIVDLLLEKGAAIEVEGMRRSLLHQAALYGHYGITRQLLRRIPEEKVVALLNAKDETAKTPLHRAAQGGHTGVAELLLEKGAVINASDDKGWTPLHVAAINGHPGCVAFLLEEGAYAEVQTRRGETPLHFAINCWGYVHPHVAESCIDILLKALQRKEKNIQTLLGNDLFRRSSFESAGKSESCLKRLQDWLRGENSTASFPPSPEVVRRRQRLLGDYGVDVQRLLALEPLPPEEPAGGGNGGH